MWRSSNRTAGLCDGFFDAPNGRGFPVSLKTDCGQDFRDRFGRLLAFVAAKDDLPAFAEGNGYDFRQLQLQAGTSTA